MLNLTVCEWIYISSVAFQLSGAVLLLIKHSFKSIEKGIAESKKKDNRVEGTTLVLGNAQPTPFEHAENVWLNRFAFALIALGYLLGVFGERNGTKAVFFAWILIISFATTTIFALFAKIIAKKNAN